MRFRRGRRLLAPSAVDPAQLDEMLRRHAASSVFVGSQVNRIRRSRRTRIPPVVGVAAPSGDLEGACWIGTNVVPVSLDAVGQDLVAAHLARKGPGYASFFGPAEPVLGLWRRLRGRWPEPFGLRPEQPLMTMAHDPGPAVLTGPAPSVRWGTPEDFDQVLPAAAHMFTEEIGYSPLGEDPAAYRFRVRQLLADQRTTVLVDPRGQLLFKADVGAVAGGVALIQGVWVNPRHRGRGLAVPCMAATVCLARQHAPVVSLYVNGFNHRALATYRHVGFEPAGTFATVLM